MNSPLERHHRRDARVVAVNGPQGSGKSTSAPSPSKPLVLSACGP